MNNRHKVKKHGWIHGRLITDEVDFNTARDAMDYAYGLEVGLYTAIKVFFNDQLVHSVECDQLTDDHQLYASP